MRAARITPALQRCAANRPKPTCEAAAGLRRPLTRRPAQHPICVAAASFDSAMRFNLLFDECKFERAQALRTAEAMVTAIEASAAA